MRRIRKCCCVLAGALVASIVTLHSNASASPGEIHLVSSTDEGLNAGGTAGQPSVSADGSLVAFASDATNLDPADTDTWTDIYVKNVATGDVRVVSTTASGVKGDCQSNGPKISADGTKVAFMSCASNFGPAGWQVYVKDLVSGALTLASSSSLGEPANDGGFDISISANGSKIAFASDSTNLHPDQRSFATDVFVKDISGTLTLVSDKDGLVPAASARGPVLSADGALVAFTSDFDQPEGEVDVTSDVILRTVGIPNRGAVVSTTNAGRPVHSFLEDMSPDGRFVAFITQDTAVDSADTHPDFDIYVRDRSAGSTRLVSSTPGGVSAAGDATAASLSADGTKAAFASNAPNLVAESSLDNDVFVKDINGGQVRVASASIAGELGNGFSGSPDLAADGHEVAFASASSNLHPSDTETGSDVFMKDLSAPDRTPPIVNLRTPADGATYTTAQHVVADYDCSDDAGGSGIASCAGTVPDGDPIDTSTTGTRSFTVTATDREGNTSARTHTYTVSAPAPPGLRIADVSGAEGPAGATTPFVFTVSLSEPAKDPVSVRYATANGRASSRSDYTARSGALTFIAGETEKTITVSVVGDKKREKDETFFVDLSSAAGAAIADGQAIATIVNDD